MVLIVLALLVVNPFMTWLLGWRSPHGYGHGLFFAGMTVIVVGLFYYFGFGRFANGVTFHYSPSIAPGPEFRPAPQTTEEANPSLSTGLSLCSAGLLTVLLGALMEYAFPQTLTALP